MRKFNTADLFNAARVIKKSGLRQELKQLIDRISKGGSIDVESVGIDTILSMIEVFAERECESAIYEVLASPLEVTADEVAAMDLETLISNLEELSKDDGLKLFFLRLSAILQKS